MTAGRPRKPAALRILEGNRGHRPIPTEPDVDATLPKRPKWLSRLARQRWDELAPMLHAAGLLKAVDCDAFASYCQTWDMWRQASDYCAKHGACAPTTNSYGAVCNAKRPEFEVMVKCQAILSQLDRQFGLTPAARAAMGTTVTKKDSDPFSAVMGAG